MYFTFHQTCKASHKTYLKLFTYILILRTLQNCARAHLFKTMKCFSPFSSVHPSLPRKGHTEINIRPEKKKHLVQFASRLYW